MTFHLNAGEAWLELANEVGWEMANLIMDDTSFAVAFGPGFTVEHHHGGFLITWATERTVTGDLPGFLSKGDPLGLTRWLMKHIVRHWTRKNF